MKTTTLSRVNRTSDNALTPPTKRRSGGAVAAVLFACLLLAGVAGVSAPAASADPTVEHAPTVHNSRINFFDFLGQGEVVQVPTGEWIELHMGWGTLTEAQRDHFVETVIVEIERDGVPQSFTPREGVDGEDWFVTYDLSVNPGRPNTPETWVMRWTFTEDHFDGFGVTPAGTIYEGRRTIVWTPRGRFPSSEYPCPNGQYPCVDV